MVVDVPVVLPLEILRLVSERLAEIGIGMLVEEFALILQLLAKLLAVVLAEVLSALVNLLVELLVGVLVKLAFVLL